MLGIQDDQLATMRAQVIELLPSPGTILAPMFVPDGAGGGALSYLPVSGGTVPIRIDPYTLRNAEKVLAEKESLIIEYTCTFPWDAPVAADYRVASGGTIYQVIGLVKEHSWNVSRRAYISTAR